MLIAPVAVILVAENLGHLKAVAGMTGRNMDPYMGRALRRRRAGDHALRLGGRQRRHHLRGEHRRDGGDQGSIQRWSSWPRR